MGFSTQVMTIWWINVQEPGGVGYVWDKQQLFSGRSDFSYFITSTAWFTCSVTVCIHFFSPFISALIGKKKKKRCLLGAILPPALIIAIQRSRSFLHLLVSHAMKYLCSVTYTLVIISMNRQWLNSYLGDVPEKYRLCAPNPTRTPLGVVFKQFKSSYSLPFVFELPRIGYSNLHFKSVTRENITGNNC